jgi:hypothetical protein
MANSGRTATPYDLASLCENCLRVFQGYQQTDTHMLLVAGSAISLIKWCRLCSIICSRHKRAVEQADKLGEILDLVEIRYIFFDEIVDQKMNLELRLQLKYTSGWSQYIRFAILPADCKYPYNGSVPHSLTCYFQKLRNTYIRHSTYRLVQNPRPRSIS